MLYVLTTIFIVALIIIIFAIINEKEEFYQKLLICENNKNVKGSLEIDRDTYKTLLLNIQNKDKKNILGIFPDNMILYIDPYINYYVFNNQNVNEYNEGIFVCLSAVKLRKCDCIWDLENKTVAYNYTSDYLMLQALIKGYRLDMKKIKIKRIRDKDLYDINVEFDFCFTYVVLGSEYMKHIMNSQYYINGFKDVDIHRLLAFYPFLKENNASMRKYFDDSIMKHYINAENVLIPIMKYAVINDVKVLETFITRLDMPEDYLGNVNKKLKDYDAYSADYGCYGNMIINNKYECDSLYNADGTPKTYYSVWDKKCEMDSDCPYYKSNIHYPNDRGGCKDGYCEFPVGVKRMGFSKYDDTGMNTPLCYNCTDTTILDCCKNSEKPDYVFPNDFNDRKKYNMKTTIMPLEYGQ
jgi:hypothetical protein